MNELQEEIDRLSARLSEVEAERDTLDDAHANVCAIVASLRADQERMQEALIIEIKDKDNRIFDLEAQLEQRGQKGIDWD